MHLPDAQAGQLTGQTAGDEHLGVITWTDSSGRVDHRTGYVRLSPSVILIIENTRRDDDVVRRVLGSAHLA